MGTIQRDATPGNPERPRARPQLITSGGPIQVSVGGPAVTGAVGSGVKLNRTREIFDRRFVVSVPGLDHPLAEEVLSALPGWRRLPRLRQSDARKTQDQGGREDGSDQSVVAHKRKSLAPSIYNLLISYKAF